MALGDPEDIHMTRGERIVCAAAFAFFFFVLVAIVAVAVAS